MWFFSQTLGAQVGGHRGVFGHHVLCAKHLAGSTGATLMTGSFNSGIPKW